jgi:hypothetical protein
MMQVRARRVLALAVFLALLAAVAAATAFATTRSAKTYTVRTTGQLGSIWIAGGGKPMTPGRLSAGNRLFEQNAIRRDDGAKGVFLGTVIVASTGTVPANRAVGLVQATYRFADGDLYVDGLLSFAKSTGSGVIVGGTGAYAGAHGTFTASEAKDVLRLQ